MQSNQRHQPLKLTPTKLIVDKGQQLLGDLADAIFDPSENLSDVAHLNEYDTVVKVGFTKSIGEQ
jgi:hypothetical protein